MVLSSNSQAPYFSDISHQETSLWLGWMKVVFYMPSLTAIFPVFHLHRMKSRVQLVFRQVAILLLLPFGTWCGGISLTMRQGDAPNVCLSLWHLRKCRCGRIFNSCGVCSPTRISLDVSWQERVRLSAWCSVWKISTTPRAPLLRRWAGSEQAVICLSKYKHGQNNERSFISLWRAVNPGLWMTGCSGLDVWTGGPVRVWQLEFCLFLLCAEALFAERDKTWFFRQGKGKSDLLHILCHIQLCKSVCVSVHTDPFFLPQNFSIC